jgi:hypothetical protein
MIISVTITSAGSDSGPFDIYSNSTGSFVLVQSNVSKAVLFQGYTMTVPDGTTVVRVESKGECTNYEDIIVDLITTTTTSTTTIAPTTTTTTAAPTTTTTTTAAPSSDYRIRSYVIANNINQVECGSATYYDYIEAVKFELTELDGITPKVNTTGADIVVNMQFDTIGCFGSGSFYRDVIIPPGQSSVNAENKGITNNCGGTGCVTETEIMSCYTSITPSTVLPSGQFYSLCEAPTTTTTTTTVAPTTARLDYQVTLAGGISYGTFNISVNGTNVYNTNATDSGYIDVPINSSIEVNIYAPPGEAEATFNSQVFANNSSGSIASDSGPNASATISFTASEDTSIVGTATTSGSNGTPVIQ